MPVDTCTTVGFQCTMGAASQTDRGPHGALTTEQQICRKKGSNLLEEFTFKQGSHGHEISGKVLKLENTISSTGNVLE